MAHFAELDATNTVLRVIVVNNSDCLNAKGQEDEAVGVAFCQNLLGGRWVQTSYNGSSRGRFAGIGYTYDAVRDVFLTPQPYPSWTLDEATTEWTAPVPRPTEGLWVWDEETLTWVEAQLPAV
jgi:hypothetical protein